MAWPLDQISPKFAYENSVRAPYDHTRYSTLEVNPSQAPYLYPQADAYANAYAYAPSPAPLPDTAKEVVPVDAPEVLLPEGVPNPVSHARIWRDRCVFGLPLRTLVVVAVVVLLVIVGAVVGGVHVLAASRVAASNYTDANGYRHRSVVFQDHTAALIVRLWDSQNETWSTVNITDRLPGARVRAGTALACSAADYLIFELHIYCQLQDDSVHAYYWHSNAATEAKAWGEEVVAVSSERSVRAGTVLSSAWQRAPAGMLSVGWWAGVYQTATGGVTVANYSGNFAAVIDASSVDQPTGLMLRPQPAADNSLSGLSLVAESDGRLVQYEFSNGVWSNDSNLNVTLPSSSDSPSALPLASTQLDEWRQSLYVGLLPNGSLARIQIGNNSLVVQDTAVVNGPAGVNFTAIAMTDDNMLYGVFDDAVHEYALNTTDAKMLTYVGMVFP